MHLSFCDWKVGFHCAVKVEWSWFPFVSICLHGVISWSQASGRGRFGSTKTVIDEKYHPPVFEFIRLRQYIIFQTNDQVLWRCLFIWACEGLSIRKALHINVWEMAWVTAMAAGGEQTQSAHARDVSLGARIRRNQQCCLCWRDMEQHQGAS